MPLFIPISKVDVAQCLVYGTISEEVPDKAGEILDYASSKPAFEEWSRQFHVASGGKSFGNVRAMHGSKAAGKLTGIHYDDEKRRIEGVAKIVDEDEWEKVIEGVYTGFSIGGGYARRWPDAANPALMRYTPVLAEVSLVDNPAVPTATFELVRADGAVELRKFLPPHPPKDRQSESQALLTGLHWLANHAHTIGARGLLAHILAVESYLKEVDEGDAMPSAPAGKAMQDHIHTLEKRIADLEAQPLPPKGALRALAKEEDRVSVRGRPLAELTPDERTHALMKTALANPMPM